MDSAKQLKFERPGPVAIRATAIGILLDCDPVESTPEVKDGVACVTVRGPLVQYANPFRDSYEAVFARVAAACASDAQSVVLKINSPGGDVFGTFETARAMRALFATAGKQAIAYVEGEASSAAYALACACERIVLTETSLIGSVGVINTIVSCARADAAQGVDVVLVTSGAHKADGNPHAPITDEAISANQEIVDDLAGVFWRWVQETRGIDASGFEAGVFVGTRAVELGLADEVSSEGRLRETLASGKQSQEDAKSVPADNDAQARGSTMADQKMIATPAAPRASAFTEAMAALAKTAEEGNDADKAKARKAIKAMIAEDKEDGGDEPKKEEAKASSDEGEKDEKKDEKKEEAKASAQASSTNSLESEIRASLIESRPDLKNDAKLQAKFAAASIADLKLAVETMPKAEFKTVAKEPEAGIRGKDGNARMIPSRQADRLAEQMGLGASRGPRVTKDPSGLTVLGGTLEQIDLAIESFNAVRTANGSR